MMDDIAARLGVRRQIGQRLLTHIHVCVPLQIARPGTAPSRQLAIPLPQYYPRGDNLAAINLQLLRMEQSTHTTTHHATSCSSFE